MQKTIVLSLSLFAVLALSALEFPPRQPEDLLFEDFSALEPGDAVPPGWNIKGDRSCFKLVKDAGKTVLELDFPMTVRVMEADTRVREDIGRAAVTRGPVVYCMEEADNGKDLHLCVLPDEAEFAEEKSDIQGVPVVKLSADGFRQRQTPAEPSGELYHVRKKPEYDASGLVFIPYFTWANRGEGEMQVFVRTR